MSNIEVKVCCPACNSQRYISNGRDGRDDRIVYKKCRECNHKGKVIRRYSRANSAEAATK
jgi:hypothetical protein